MPNGELTREIGEKLSKCFEKNSNFAFYYDHGDNGKDNVVNITGVIGKEKNRTS